MLVHPSSSAVISLALFALLPPKSFHETTHKEGWHMPDSCLATEDLISETEEVIAASQSSTFSSGLDLAGVVG